MTSSLTTRRTFLGASHVSKGRPFRYPFNLRILR